MSASEKPVLIAFAGPIGSSKTPIATYLGCTFNLPVFSNDAIRKEVIEDTGSLVEKEYEKRRDERLFQLAEKHISFIYDASIDRRWSDLKKELEARGYRWFIISLDLSFEFVEKLHRTKQYSESAEYLAKNFKEHGTFLEQFGDDIGLSIADETFPERLKLADEALKVWLAMGA